MSPGRITEQSHSGPAPPNRFSTIRWLVGIPTALATEKEVIRFSLIAPASCLITSTIAVPTLWLARVVSSADFVTNWVTWYVGDSIGTLIFAPLVLIWTFRAADWRRNLSVTVPMAFTLTVVVALFFQTNRWEQGRIKMEFEQRTGNLTQKLQSDFDGYLDVLRSIQNFFASSPAVSQSSFHSFVARDISDHPGIQWLSWDARVPRSKVSAFVEAAHRDGLATFQLNEREAQQKLIPLTARNEYVVIRYIEPLLGNERSLGFDIASDPVRREAFEWARDKGEARATKQAQLIQDKDTAPGFVVYLPIYTNGFSHDTVEERQHRLEGYVAAVFRVADVIAQSLKGVDQKGLQLRFLNQSAGSTTQTLFQNSTERASPAVLQMKTNMEM